MVEDEIYILKNDTGIQLLLPPPLPPLPPAPPPKHKNFVQFVIKTQHSKALRIQDYLCLRPQVQKAQEVLTQLSPTAKDSLMTFSFT